jgi:hypothetical protein
MRKTHSIFLLVNSGGAAKKAEGCRNNVRTIKSFGLELGYNWAGFIQLIKNLDINNLEMSLINIYLSCLLNRRSRVLICKIVK